MSGSERKSPTAKRRDIKGARNWLSYVIMLAVVVFGVYRAGSLKWYCDDIFITLRYVKNLFAGYGLVYNQGEYVQGYTHALWLAVLALSRWLGFDQLGASLNIGLGAYAGVLVVFSLISYRLYANRLVVFVPFTALALALNLDFQVWATGGLETMFFTFLCSLAFVLYYFTGVKKGVKTFLTGTLLILAVLTRPDGALIFILANVFLIVRDLLFGKGFRSSVRELVLFNLAFVLLYLPYMIWQWSYYGDIFPNTYYAKSSNLSYYSRGFFYLWLYFKAHFTSFLFILGIPVIVVKYRGAASSGKDGWRARIAGLAEDRKYAGLLFALCAILVYSVLFVARVGGDFMYARFVVPIVPFAMFVAEVSVLDLFRNRRVLPALVLIGLACVVGIGEKESRDRLLLENDNGKLVTVSHHGIIDERHYYKYDPGVETELRWAQDAAPLFRGLDATVLLIGQAGVGYYGGFKTCIEYYGLTDKYIAHMPLESRSRVGHEKSAPLDYLVERGADFLFSRKWPYSDRPKNYRRIAFNLENRGVTGYLITYDADLIGTLSERFGAGFEHVDFTELLDWYINTKLPQVGYDELHRDYEEFRQFYFMHNDDANRESIFLGRLSQLKP
jgi:hypothetical protein